MSWQWRLPTWLTIPAEAAALIAGRPTVDANDEGGLNDGAVDNGR
jgi:hypothetical protein